MDGLWRSEADVAPARIGTGRRVHNTTNHNTTMTHSLTHWLDVSEKIVAATSVNQANAASALRATSVRLIKRDHRGNGDVHTAVVNNRSLQLPACNIHTVNTEHCVVSFGKSAMQAHLTVAVEGYNGLDPRCTDYSQYCDRPMRAANIRAEATQLNNEQNVTVRGLAWRTAGVYFLAELSGSLFGTDILSSQPKLSTGHWGFHHVVTAHRTFDWTVHPLVSQ